MNNFKKLSSKEKAEYISIIVLYPFFMLFSALGKSLKLFGTKKRQITASVLSFAMILTMIPVISLTASAAETGVKTVEIWATTAEMEAALKSATQDIKFVFQKDITGSFSVDNSCPYNITIDLNGNSLKSTTNNNLIANYGTGKVTIMSGIMQVNTEYSAVGCSGGGTMEINNVSIKNENTKSSSSCAVGGSGNILINNSTIEGSIAVLTTGNGTYEINNSQIKGYMYAIYHTSAAPLKLINSTIYNQHQQCTIAVAEDSNNTYGKPTLVEVSGCQISNDSGDSRMASTFSMWGDCPIKFLSGTTILKGAYTAFPKVPDVSGYANAKITASTSILGTELVPYNPDDRLTYKYLKIEPDKSITTWEELQTAINAGGEIKLTQDIVASSTDARLNVPSGVTVTIDLNGYKINRNLTTAVENGSVFYINGGNLTIKDTSTSKNGQITGCRNAGWGGGVYIGSGTFTMNGGSITGNTASAGGGVFNWEGSFTMNGGSITGNTASECGGGVYNWSTFNVSGSATVKDNKKTDGTTSNVYLQSYKYITVTDALTGEIGVTTVKKPTATSPVTVTKASLYPLTANDVSKLINDVDGYEIVKSGDVAVLQKAIGTLTKDNFTFTAPTDATYSGSEKTATVTAKNGVSCGAITVKCYNASGALVANPTNVGTYTVKISVAGNDNYKAITDLEVGSFDITAKVLTESDLAVVGIGDKIYTGSAIKPVPTVKYGDTTLTENTDYTLSYGTNTAIGKGSVTINFKGNYSGSATYEFNIAYGDAIKWVNVDQSVNGWYNKDITISPAYGFTISKTATGFARTIILTDETADGSQEIYLHDMNGRFYKGNITYKLDKTAPTDVKIQYNNSGFKSFLSTITFGLFFNKTVNVTAQATDTLSGVDTIQYYAADSAVADVSTITGWQNSLSLTQNSKKVVYIKVTDKAGNVTITNNEGVVVYTDSALTSTSADFDRDNQADITIPINFNGNTVNMVHYDLPDRGGILFKDTDYTVTTSSIIIKADTISENLETSGMDIIIFSNPMGVEFTGDENVPASLTFKINDATHYHSGTYHAKVKPTCTTDGNEEHWSCTCGKNFYDSGCAIEITKVVIDKLGHNLTATAAKEATCDMNGNSAYWYCSTCKKYFSDASCTTETTLANTVVARLGHIYGSSTYSWKGNNCYAKRPCTRNGCGMFEMETVVASAVVTQKQSCTHDELTTYTAIFTNDEFGTQTKTDVKTADKLGHSFTSYVSDNNASYFADGTETAHCDHTGCTETDTRTAVGSKLVDNAAPTVSMTIGTNSWNSLLNSITFGLFFKETQTVTVTANDVGSGVDKTYYYLANSETTDFTGISWTEFKDSFNISPNNKYVVYVKVTDKVGNETVINSDGIVLENVVPQISTENGKTYCAAVEVTVTDDNLDTVTLNGDKVTLTDGKFTVSPKDGEQTIVATDKAGNSTTVKITVNDGHTWDDGKVTSEPTTEKAGEKTLNCEHCDATKTEPIAMLRPSMTEKDDKYVQGDKDGLTFKSNAALSDLINVSVDGKELDKSNYTTKEGSTIVTLKPEYLDTLSAGTHTLDIKSVSGTASAEFTIEAKAADTSKPGDTTSPQTGDTSNMILWLAILFVSGGALTVFGISKKRRKVNGK